MTRLIPQLTGCFHCICVRSGTLIIAFLYMLGCFYSVVHNSIIAAQVRHPLNTKDENDIWKVQREFINVHVSYAIYSGISFYASLLLVIGGFKHIPAYIYIWVYYNVIWTLLTLSYFITLAVMYHIESQYEYLMNHLRVRFRRPELVYWMAIIGVIITCFSVYFTLVVYSFYRTMGNPDKSMLTTTVDAEPDASASANVDASDNVSA